MPKYRLLGMGSMHLRALRNGVVAAVLTALAGFTLNALVGSDGSSEASGSPSPSATTSPACTPETTALDRAAVRGLTGRFADVWFASPREAWAVGSEGDEDSAMIPVLAGWDGEGWSASADAAHLGVAALQGVDGSDPSDVWAVGWSTDGFGRDPLIVHYDGRSWKRTTLGDGELTDVRALAADDVWAVGSLGNPAFVDERATAMHWDGTTWTQEAVPAGGGKSGLTSIAGTADDLWAAGYHHRGPLLLHFDGTAWERVAGIEKGGPLSAVAVADGTVWLAGSSLLRGDGSSFAEVVAPRHGEAFADVAAVSADRAFAVGSVSSGSRSRSLALEIDGGDARAAPVRGPGSDALQAVAVVRGDAWLAGWHDAPKGPVPLVATLAGC